MSALAQPAPAAAAKGMSLVEAMSLARRSVALFTELQIDAVASCERAEAQWRVCVDVIEAAARMGDNDLLCTYEVMIDAGGEVTRFTRVQRYHRNDAARL